MLKFSIFPKIHSYPQQKYSYPLENLPNRETALYTKTIPPLLMVIGQTSKSDQQRAYNLGMKNRERKEVGKGKLFEIVERNIIQF